MKGLIKLVVTVIVGIILVNGFPMSVSAHTLDNFDIKTANASTVTAESIDKKLKDSAGEIWQGQGKTIMDISEATGINAAFFLGKMFGEVGWGTDKSSDIYQTNNPGNISRPDDGSPYAGDAGYFTSANGREWAKYSSMEMGLKTNAELLNAYYVTDNLKTVAPILSKWAPAGDGNNHDQMKDIIQSIAKSFGQDLTTGGALNVGSGKYEVAKEGGDKVGDIVDPKVDFHDLVFASPAEYIKGTQTPNGLGSTMVAGFARFSSDIFEKSKVVTSFMAVALIGYMILSIGLVLIGYNGLFGGNDMVTKASDAILGEGIEYNRQGLFKLFKRTVVGIFILALVISGVYALGFVVLYGAIMYF